MRVGCDGGVKGGAVFLEGGGGGLPVGGELEVGGALEGLGEGCDGSHAGYAVSAEAVWGAGDEIPGDSFGDEA